MGNIIFVIFFNDSEFQKSIDSCLKYLFRKKYSKNNTGIFMFVGTTVLYEYMNSLKNDVCNLLVNTHVRIKYIVSFIIVLFI